MFELNYSKINAYNFCNYLYKFIYVDGRYIKHNPKTSLGISVHRALSFYAKNRLDLDGLLISYEENWNNSGFETPQQMMEYYELGIDLLKKFYQFEKENPSEIFSYDDFFEVDIDDDFVLRGTVDRIDRLGDRTLEIIDYKLGLDEKKEFHNKSELQLLVYAYGIGKKYGIKVSRMTYYYIGIPRKHTLDCILNENEFISYLKDIGRNMRSMVFEKKGKCDICLAKDMCNYRE